MLINLASQYAPWLPSRLFANGQQGVWYVPQPVYRGQQVLFQDAAGTTPVTTDGDPVGLMLDLSPNSHNASQSTAASKPIYRTDGILHWLEFDGVDDHLINGTLPALGSQARFVAVAAEPISLDGSAFEDTYVSLGDKSVTSGMFQLTPHGTMHFVGSACVSGAIAHSVGTSGVMTGVYDGASDSEVRTDGVVGATNASTPTLDTQAGLVIGAADNGAGSIVDHGNVKLFGVVIVDEDKTRDITNAENYLANLAGTSL